MRPEQGLYLAVLSSLAVVQAKDPNQTVLNEWPMIMAHDASTTYLDPADPLHKEIYRWTITQPSNKGTSGLLECGVRAFDWRPQIDSKTGEVYMHHGPIEVKHPMKAAMQEIVSWAANNTGPYDLVIVGITNCNGDNCTEKVQELLTQLEVKYITRCTDLKGLTVSAAMKHGQLPNGGQVLAIFDCWVSNYDPSVACSGYLNHNEFQSADIVNRQTMIAKTEYNCWQESKSHDIPFQNIYNYLDKVRVSQ